MHDATGTLDIVVQAFRQQHCRIHTTEDPICHELILMQFPHWISEAFPQLAPVQLVPCHHIVRSVFLTTLPHAIYSGACRERIRYRRILFATNGSGLLDGVSIGVLVEYRTHGKIGVLLFRGIDHGGYVIRQLPRPARRCGQRKDRHWSCGLPEYANPYWPKHRISPGIDPYFRRPPE